MNYFHMLKDCLWISRRFDFVSCSTWPSQILRFYLHRIWDNLSKYFFYGRTEISRRPASRRTCETSPFPLRFRSCMFFPSRQMVCDILKLEKLISSAFSKFHFFCNELKLLSLDHSRSSRSMFDLHKATARAMSFLSSQGYSQSYSLFHLTWSLHFSRSKLGIGFKSLFLKMCAITGQKGGRNFEHWLRRRKLSCKLRGVSLFRILLPNSRYLPQPHFPIQNRERVLLSRPLNYLQ